MRCNSQEVDAQIERFAKLLCQTRYCTSKVRPHQTLNLSWRTEISLLVCPRKTWSYVMLQCFLLNIKKNTLRSTLFSYDSSSIVAHVGLFVNNEFQDEC